MTALAKARQSIFFFFHPYRPFHPHLPFFFFRLWDESLSIPVLKKELKRRKRYTCIPIYIYRNRNITRSLLRSPNGQWS